MVPKGKLPFVTIQIPTKNEIIALRCARKCLAFDYPKSKYEIIIGDDSTDKKISKRIKKFAAKYRNVKVTKRLTNEGYKPGNLNHMLKYSKGDIIVIFDSDFAPEKDFLKRIVVPFKDKNVSAVQARWKFSNADQNLVTALGSSIVYTGHQVLLLFLRKHKKGFLCGSAEAVRKNDLVKAGGWKMGSLTEDIEYSLRLHKQGKRIYYMPGLECYNEAPSTPKDLYKQQMRWAHGVISAYKAHTKELLTAKNLSGKDKFMAMMGSCFGYTFPVTLFLIVLFGILSFFTIRVAPVDWGTFLFDISKNILITAGLLITGSVALIRAKKATLIPKMIFSSFTIGLVTTFYVNKGIAKALMNKPMKWYMLKKSTKTR
jgi:cellulose synthase/poly-beta-1,6-N-acetylglucosamine synthase-like glycosyltransferase